MKKLILSLSALLLLSSCTAGQSDKNITDTSIKTEASSTNSTTYKQDIEDTSSKIKDSVEFEGCMKQQSSMCIQSAGMQIAQKMKDSKFCQELSNLEQRSSCEFAVVMINAQEKNDITLCDSLTSENYKQQCKMQLYKQDAIAKNDITLCDKIDIMLKSANTGELNTGMGAQKDQCIMQFIMNNSTSTELDCEKILDEGSLMMCKMMIKEKVKGPAVPNNSTSIPK